MHAVRCPRPHFSGDRLLAILQNTSTWTLFIILIGVLLSIHGLSQDARLGTLLEDAFNDDFTYSVLVEVQGEEAFAQTYGYEDKRKTRRADSRTLFNIASITKSFTAVGILQLVEAGKISLHDTLEKFFRSVPDDKKSITIAQLLTHMSGLEQNYLCEGIANSREARQAILSDALAFTPGTDFAYSNANYQLLAMIIEGMSDMRYDEYIEQHILDTLGMSATRFWHQVDEKDHVAWASNKGMKIFGQRNWAYIGATGIFSTAEDLRKFWHGVYDHVLLSEKSVKTLFRGYHKTALGLEIGMGFYKNSMTRWNSRELWTRGSESWGHNAVIRYFPEKETLIIVCTNSGEYSRPVTTGNRVVSDLVADALLTR